MVGMDGDCGHEPKAKGGMYVNITLSPMNQIRGFLLS